MATLGMPCLGLSISERADRQEPLAACFFCTNYLVTV